MPFLFLFVTACTTSKVNPNAPILFEVHFGNYGGFSNQSTEYVLYKNGQISKIENNAKDVRLSTIMKVFNALKAKVKMTIDFDANSHLEIA